MSLERQWIFRIFHTLDAIGKIQRYTAGMSFEHFCADDRTVDAVIRNFLVIGEATRHVPSNVRQESPDIPWHLMEGMRHVLVHDYETVRFDILWKTVVEDLPPLVEGLRRLANEA